ncbi:TRCF domain [Chlamydia trachomatis]|nr:TRCF domain [Chlamydia trachomatis]
MIDRFGEYPDVVAYLLEISLLKYFADQMFTETIIRKQDQILVNFEARAGQIFLTQDYFQALSLVNLKARIAENSGRMQLIFDIRKKKDFEILEELMKFAEKMLEIKLSKENKL